jgi:hypothetical protein
MMSQKLHLGLIVLITLALGSGQIQVQAADRSSEMNLRAKITFDLDQLNDQGLHGPADGLRALAYEFCIPADPRLQAQVKAIDPTLVVFAGSKGRIKCSQGEYLCLGNTHQPEFRAVLLKLASLPYVKQINQCFFE